MHGYDFDQPDTAEKIPFAYVILADAALWAGILGLAWVVWRVVA